MVTLRKDYLHWLWVMKKNHPEIQLTSLGDLTLDVLGTQQQPVLRAKAHETLTLLRWLAGQVLPQHQASIPKGSVWTSAGDGLLRMWQLMESAPMVVPDHTLEDRWGDRSQCWKRLGGGGGGGGVQRQKKNRADPRA